MKIKGWDKINGFAYKGYVITNAEYDAQADAYFADIFNLNDSGSKGWFMNLWPAQMQNIHILRITDIASAPKSTQVQKGVTSNEILTIQHFRTHYETLVDEMLIQLDSAKTNQFNGTTGPSKGIINQVMNAGTSVTYSIATPSSHSISNGLNNLSAMKQALDALKELEEQLDKLKANNPL